MADSKDDSIITLQDELVALCFELGTGGLSTDQVARLEQILLENPQLQDAYCRLVTVDNLMHTEFGENGRTFPSVLCDLPTTCDSLTVLGSSESECSDGEMLVCKSPRSLAVTTTRRKRWTFAAVAAAVATMIAVVSHQTVDYWLAKTGQAVSSEFGQAPNVPGEYVVLRSQLAIDMLHRVTNAAWQSNSVPFRTPLDEELEGEISDRLFQGTALLKPFNSLAAGGFVVLLPPGAMLELNVFADSVGENALAVMELDAKGRPTGELVSFSNLVGARNTENSRVYGELGTWSERNGSKKDKYYLLTGMQRMEGAEPNTETKESPTWYVADCSVIVERPDLLHIGWDDSGWSADLDRDPRIDKDFNDLAATIRIRHPDAGLQTLQDEVRTFPELDYEQLPSLEADVIQHGYPFTVEPGQGLILTVTGSARLPNSFALVNQQTGRIWWQRGNTSPDPTQLGAYVIENHSYEPLSLALVGQYQTSMTVEAGPWIPSTHRVILDGDRCQIIGFEDAGLDRDWNDVRVNLHWIYD